MKNKILLLLLTSSTAIFCAEQPGPAYPQPEQNNAPKDSNEFQSYMITQEVAKLWANTSKSNYSSPYLLLQQKRPDLARKIKETGIIWELSLQDLINAGGAKKLENVNGKFENLQLTSLKGLQNIPNIAQIKKLNLNGNQITTIPDNIFDKLTQLKYLSLNNNQITTIPENIFDKLAQLKQLYLNGNQISTIPDTIFDKLTQLEWLRLDNNQIASIPENLFNNLIQLKRLDLNNNQIATIPDNLFNKLRKLKQIDLNNNPIKPSQS